MFPSSKHESEYYERLHKIWDEREKSLLNNYYKIIDRNINKNDYAKAKLKILFLSFEGLRNVINAADYVLIEH